MKLDLKAKHTTYKTKAGEKVPGVTSVLGVFAKQALYGWYAGEERAGVMRVVQDTLKVGGGFGIISELLPVNAEGEPQWFANIKRDAAADLGKVAHAHIDAHFKKDSLEPDGIDPKMYEQGKQIALRYLTRLVQDRFVCVHSELVMVDEDLCVGGTGDRFGMIGNDWVYRDYKSSKPWYKGLPYNETVAQSCGYAMMFEKQTGEPVKRIFIDRGGKTPEDSGDYFELTTEQRAVGERWFKLGVQAYYCDRDMKDSLATQRVR